MKHQRCQVVTWQSPNGATVNVCAQCEEHFKQIEWWPKDETGREFCRVSYGAHRGSCSYCPDGSGRQMPVAEEGAM